MTEPNLQPILNAVQAEPCPAPLAWQEVVREVSQAARPIEFQWETGRLQGLDYGAGPPLIFLPTATGTHRMFALTAWLLREDFRCLLLGNVEWNSTPWISQLTQQTALVLHNALTQYLGESCSLYASGTSVSTALQLLRTAPELVNQAILQGGGLGAQLTWAERLMLNWARWSRKPLHKTPLWMSVQAQNHRPWFPPFDESRFGFMMHEMGDQRRCDVATRLLADANSSRHLSPAIQQPVLLLDCEGHGKLATQQLDRLATQLPHVQRESLHSAGLFPYLTHPHRLVKILKGFLNSPATIAIKAN